MLLKTLASSADLLELFLRVVSFPLQHDKRSRQLVSEFCAAALEFFLTPAQFFQLAFLLLNLILLSLERDELLLRFLHLRIEVLSGVRLLFA